MKFSLLTFTLLLVGTSFAQINFQNLTFEQAKAKATLEKKKIFIDVFTTWCGPCKIIDRNVFQAAEIGDRMNPDYIAIKMDAENSPDRAQVLAYGIKGYPTMLILDNNGKELHRIVGSMGIEAFHRELDTQVPFDQLPQNIALNEMAENQKDEAIWRKNMAILRVKDEVKFYDNCQTFVNQFGLNALNNQLDSAIFFNAILPLDGPIVKRILSDDEFMPWFRLMYKELDLTERARTAPTKAKYDAVIEEAKAMHTQLEIDYMGDIMGQEDYLAQLFPADLNPMYLQNKEKKKESGDVKKKSKKKKKRSKKEKK